MQKDERPMSEMKDMSTEHKMIYAAKRVRNHLNMVGSWISRYQARTYAVTAFLSHPNHIASHIPHDNLIKVLEAEWGEDNKNTGDLCIFLYGAYNLAKTLADEHPEEEREEILAAYRAIVVSIILKRDMDQEHLLEEIQRIQGEARYESSSTN